MGFNESVQMDSERWKDKNNTSTHEKWNVKMEKATKTAKIEPTSEKTSPNSEKSWMELLLIRKSI